MENAVQLTKLHLPKKRSNSAKNSLAIKIVFGALGAFMIYQALISVFTTLN
uniref:hypothetical protein n=1 Tax=Roseivirga sp. TaxID=1964215 RepID=UPI0040485347